jgi:hypothetical protein
MKRRPPQRAGRRTNGQSMIAKLLKYLFYLIVLGAFGIVVYAYVGPHLGEDFARPQQEIRQQVTLDAE